GTFLMVILVIVRFLATVCHKINFLAPPKVLLTRLFYAKKLKPYQTVRVLDRKNISLLEKA
ncbi:MAG: hypothetical protein UW91_C0008G0001, partial [Parcubacteria group bacterium GW2011_GWF2_45_11]